jgi:Arc/MetJ-type ribon-helix-helix transcriptional regulator
MTPKLSIKVLPKVRVVAGAIPLCDVPELREFLAPILGKGGTRDHVVMMRLGAEAVARLDELVDAGLFGSRSEAAAFLVGAGIQGQKKLFEKISKQSAAIKRIRESLRATALETLRAAAAASRADAAKARRPKEK